MMAHDPMRHVLVVDDDELILSPLTILLQMHGHSVAVARDGSAMLASHAAQPADVAILDIMQQGEEASRCTGGCA